MGITSLSITDALLIALSGVVTVFLMLACLSLIIVVISKFVAITSKSQTDSTQTTAPVSQAVAPEGAFGGEVKLIDVDEKTAACIMAIVSHETKIPLNELVFKNIKAL